MISGERILRLAVLVTALGASSAIAEKANYWVLGSYAKANNAHQEQARLETLLNKPIEIRFDKNLAVFRVLTPASATSKADLGDVDAWLLPIDLGETAAPDPLITEIATEKDVLIEEDEPPIVILEPPPEPLYPEFADGETLFEYCQRLPDARLCQHPRIEKAVEMDKKLAEERSQLDGVCDEITRPDWLETCRSLYPE